MFKKLYGKINTIYEKQDRANRDYNRLLDGHYDLSQLIKDNIKHIPKVKSLENIIESQQRTIEQLTNALKDKYEHGLFVYSEDGHVIKAIQDGEEISLHRMSYLDVTWSAGESVGVTIERR